MLWDIFCRVIDNHGDLGVCWRLSANLAAKGHRIRLWVDDASALAWMAPQANLNAQGWAKLSISLGEVEVRPWNAALNKTSEPSDVWVEAFGCELPEHFVQWAYVASSHFPHQKSPVWINLEYLSAESYVERSHRLPSPVMSGPLKGRTKWFFYPGFTEKTGGLLRESFVDEANAVQEQSSGQFMALTPAYPSKTSLFCYEPAALTEALQLSSLNASGHVWQVAHGRGALAFDKALHDLPSKLAQPRFEKIAPLPQPGYDELLQSCDLNFVRGEDSLVRALWTGQALVWHIYPQDDGAHAVKLNAFLDWLEAPPSLRQFHLRWNGLSELPLPEIDLIAWRSCIQAARRRLMKQSDLVTQLLQFVAEKG
ncbi:elongation factor P maturation arginine rhamnosyltransferase EarP [Limnohabitans sp. Rim11]|uniref:elongation factor P maturation arginine rhamnosyltransferase EarP n=1 Tax=Limnohabitans sp. Rim11 TaxID=1100719 RepID=UPI000AF8CAB9|nr:elongation factor P maturation arginine rhamnosyltransferase EarP [Limnohabitans sp. Rim11]